MIREAKPCGEIRERRKGICVERVQEQRSAEPGMEDLEMSEGRAKTGADAEDLV